MKVHIIKILPAILLTGCRYSDFGMNSRNIIISESEYGEEQVKMWSTVNTIEIGPYSFESATRGEILSRIIGDAQATISNAGCHYNIGFSGSIANPYEKCSFHVGKMTVWEMLERLSSLFRVRVTYDNGLIRMTPDVQGCSEIR